jgi:hypothetical protein
MGVETSKPSSDAGLRGTRSSVRTSAGLVIASGTTLFCALAAHFCSHATRAVLRTARRLLPKFDHYTVSDGGPSVEIFADKEGVFLFIRPTQYALLWPWVQV